MMQSREIRISQQTYYYDHQKMASGKGSFGEVFQGLHEIDVDGTKQQIACCVKRIQKTNNTNSDKVYEREKELIQMLRKRGNQNIVKVFEVIETNNLAYLVMEKCDEDLEDYFIRKGLSCTFEEISDIAKQIFNGYKALEKQNIIHRDIKFENILLRGNVVKITDFGMGRILPRIVDVQPQLTRVGTPLYAAPQLFTKDRYTNKADMYSLGVLIYRLIYGKYPIDCKNQAEVRQKLLDLKTNPIVCLETHNSSPQMRKYVENMLRYEEKDRPLWSHLYQSDGLTKAPSIILIP